MSGFGNPFKDIPKAIAKSIKEKVTGKSNCHWCERERKIKEMVRDYLDRWRCIDEFTCECVRQNNLLARQD